MRIVRIHLESDQFKRLERLKRLTGAPIAEIIRRAIDKAYPPGEADRDKKGEERKE